MKIAIEGCAHGELDKIYEVIGELEKENNFKVDLLLICGDFQSVRNSADLQCMAVPSKFRKLNTFYKYYSGEKTAPVLTIFIGGNHEASNYLTELHYGGWVAPNIYYLGCSSVVQFGGIRIAGLSGIYKGHDYYKGHFEIPPFNQGTIRSVYHIRKFDVFKLSQVNEPLDIVLSHDWPRGIYEHGHVGGLLKRKPFFQKEVEERTLGSQPAEELLSRLKPRYWFSAHLHCKFAALVPHKDGTETKFLALDKCLPRRKFLQVIDVEAKNGYPMKLAYDLEWLSILRKTDHLLNITQQISVLPRDFNSSSSAEESDGEKPSFLVTESDRKEITNLLIKDNIEIGEALEEENSSGKCYLIPHNFEIGTPAAYTENSKHVPIIPRTNSQTTKFCDMLGITDPIAKFMSENKVQNISIADFSGVSSVDEESFGNPDEIDLGSEDDEEPLDNSSKSTRDSSANDSQLDTKDDGGRPLFVIDNKPSATSTPFKRLAMVLPAPKTETPSSPLEDQGVRVMKRLSETEDCQKTGTPVGEIQGNSKVFKRRNLALYANKSEEDS